MFAEVKPTFTGSSKMEITVKGYWKNNGKIFGLVKQKPSAIYLCLPKAKNR
jgi:hypothetical protein